MEVQACVALNTSNPNLTLHELKAEPIYIMLAAHCENAAEDGLWFNMCVRFFWCQV